MYYYFSIRNALAVAISIFLLLGCADVASNIGQNEIVTTDRGVVFGMFKISASSPNIRGAYFGVALKRLDRGLGLNANQHQDPIILQTTFTNNLVAVALDPGQYGVVGAAIFTKNGGGVPISPAFSKNTQPIITFDLKAGQAVYLGSYTLDVSIDGNNIQAKIANLTNDLATAENQLYLRSDSFKKFEIQPLAPSRPEEHLLMSPGA